MATLDGPAGEVTLSVGAPTLDREVVGVIPAAGRARRIAPLPCSKELYPVGFGPAGRKQHLRPKVVSQYLLEKMCAAGVTKAFVVIRGGKWDIPAYYKHGAGVGMHLAYLMRRSPFGAPYTVDQAYPFVRNAVVAFGFPDILFDPVDGFSELLACEWRTNADLVLGVFPADRPEIMDMVEVDDEGVVHAMWIKPDRTELRFAWIFAVWSPVFTGFQHEFLRREAKARTAGSPTGGAGTGGGELAVGHVIQAAIRSGLHVRAVAFPHGKYLDIGTPDNLIRAVREGAESFAVAPGGARPMRSHSSGG